MLIADERLDATLVAPGDEVPRLVAEVSAMWAHARVEPDSEVIGALIRSAQLRQLAATTDFESVASPCYFSSSVTARWFSAPR